MKTLKLEFFFVALLCLKLVANYDYLEQYDPTDEIKTIIDLFESPSSLNDTKLEASFSETLQGFKEKLMESTPKSIKVGTNLVRANKTLY